MYIRQVNKSLKKGTNNWCSEIHKLAIKYNLVELWNKENKNNELQTQSANLKQGWNKYLYTRIQEVEEEEWRVAMSKKPKLRTYIKFKKKLEVEKYLVSSTQKPTINLLTRIRTGTNKLRIETGRWTKEEEKDRRCRICFNGEVEDESHFMLRCETYSELRSKMYNKITAVSNINMLNKTEDEQLVILMNPGTNYLEINEIVKEYIKSAYKRRFEI